jgi:hypothetical protein
MIKEKSQSKLLKVLTGKEVYYRLNIADMIKSLQIISARQIGLSVSTDCKLGTEDEISSIRITQGDDQV